jgi:hypothetical protein
MRRLGLSLVMFAFGCGDNARPALFVDTKVAAARLAAGDPVGAKCTLVDNLGNPALDTRGNSLTDATMLVVSYEAPESFAVDANGDTVAAKAGTATVRCSAPTLGLVDDQGAHVLIVPGPPVRAITRLDRPTTLAGVADGVSCLAFDAYDNAVTGFSSTLALSPAGAGTSATSSAVTATLAGEYTVSCVVSGAADVATADLVVIPALPASLVAALDPERSLYAVLDQVTLIASAFDIYGNRVDDVAYQYGSSPTVPSPSPARFQFNKDGTYQLSATTTTPTEEGTPLSVSLPAVVDSNGPTIDCRRIDASNVSAEAYMVQQAPATVRFPVHISAAFAVRSVTIGGTNASFDPGTGNFVAPVAIGFGMNFVDVVATDTNNVQNSTTCFVLAASNYGPELATMPGALSLSLGQYAIGDPDPSGLDSLNDLFYTVVSSPALQQLVDSALVGANPISSGGCGFFACQPNVNYNGGTIAWDQPSTSLTLINGGLQANVFLPNVRLSVNACGTFCCPGGSNIEVTASFIAAQVNFSLTLSGGRVRTSVNGQPSVVVGSVSLNGSGFCGFIINLIQGFFTGTVRNAVQSSLANFINNNVGPMLDGITSSLDISTLAKQFAVPRLDGAGAITLLFGLGFSSLDITSVRALIGIATRFIPQATTVTRPSLGIAQRLPSALLDPPGTSNFQPVGIAAYEGLLNEVLHGLWRGGFLQATLNIAGGTAVIDSWLPPVAAINPNNTATLELGGVQATLTIPGIIDNPIQIMFGGNANATVTMNGNSLVFGNLQLQQLFVSFQVTLSQSQRDAMETFLTSALKDVLSSAINNGLPAFPIPSFTLPASVANFGLPAGARLGIVNPVLNTQNSYCVLDGQFGAQ